MRIVLVAVLMFGCGKEESANTSRVKEEAEAAGKRAAKKVEESKGVIKKLQQEAGEIDVLVKSAEEAVSSAQNDADRAAAKAKLDVLRRSKRKLTDQIKAVEQETEDLVGGGATFARLMEQMRGFRDDMCRCRDKACADRVQEAMNSWGTELTKKAGTPREERPNPEETKQASDIMISYAECMTKLMMAGAGGPAEAPPN